MNKSCIKIDTLRIERLKKKLTLKNMSNLLGFKSPTSYYNIEKGNTIPKLDVMINISNILEIPVDNFFIDNKFNNDELNTKNK